MLMIAACYGWIPGGGIEGLDREKSILVLLLPIVIGAGLIYGVFQARYGVQEWIANSNELRWEWGWMFSAKRGSHCFRNCRLELRCLTNAEGVVTRDICIFPPGGLPRCVWQVFDNQPRTVAELYNLANLVADCTGWSLRVPKELERGRRRNAKL